MRFEFLHGPGLATVDGVVIVLLVGCPDDQDNMTVHNTLIHDSKPFVSMRKKEKKRSGPVLSGVSWLQVLLIVV